LQAFLKSERTSDESESRALASALMAALEIASRGDWAGARRDLGRAVELAPYKSEYRNMLGVADTYLCCAGSPAGEYGDPARDFADALSLAPDNVEALKNLYAFLSLLDELSPTPIGIDASRLGDRREVVQRVVTSVGERAP
jgi:Tfp pilus assembly protein PilF